ncbi:MAG: hypothetical protein IJF73_00750 [Clostridia bacterium]|nr:hypothetical protein [Clostridia bacterium]
MKKIRMTAALMLPVMLLLLLTSCGMITRLTHEHEWQYRVAKAPTCTEGGLMEALCVGCGEKTYNDIERTEHSYVNGICRDCGAQGSIGNVLERVVIPAGVSTANAWSLYKVYETARTIDTGIKASYTTFVSSFSGVYFKDAYLDSLGLFHTTISAPYSGGRRMETPLALSIGEIAIQNPKASVGRLIRMDIVDNELIATYAGGTTRSAGSFTSSGLVERITGFGLSEGGELLIFYSDDKVAFAGTIDK